MSKLSERIENAYNHIKTKTNAKPQIGLVLGSGLGDFVNNFTNSQKILFSEIPDFPVSTVVGHDGAFVFGDYEGISIVALSGRVHYYEGYQQSEITMPIRIMKKFGVETVILTNACGGINLNFSSGALMLISDHINASGGNPLIGENLDEFCTRFPDVSDIYTRDLRKKLLLAAEKEGIKLHEGVYVMYSGPNYETAAEIKYFRIIGGDAIGMSTVPEALVAAHCNMKLIGISCITNMATGVLDQKLSHAEVIEVAARVKGDFTRLLHQAILLK